MQQNGFQFAKLVEINGLFKINGSSLVLERETSSNINGLKIYGIP